MELSGGAQVPCPVTQCHRLDTAASTQGSAMRPDWAPDAEPTPVCPRLCSHRCGGATRATVEEGVTWAVSRLLPLLLMANHTGHLGKGF